MKREFISIGALKKVLTSKEMKNVLGGSDDNGGGGSCCYSGTAYQPGNGQWIYYEDYGVSAAYCIYLAVEFKWDGFECNC